MMLTSIPHLWTCMHEGTNAYTWIICLMREGALFMNSLGCCFGGNLTANISFQDYF